jgi:hypothetical protein
MQLRRRIRNVNTLRVAIPLALAVCNVLPPLSQADIQLGQLTFARADAQPLDDPTQLAMGLQSYSFMSSVGGVAFGAVATGANDLKITTLEYNARQPDGQRLLITVASKNGRQWKLSPPIMDWQLAPTARFAEGDQHACFTLFGRLTNSTEQQQRLARGEKILGYHRAFQDTLLGLRLMQADMLIIRPDACDLPRDGGHYLVAPNESPRSVALNTAAYNQLVTIVEQLPQKFDSYVICDYGQEIVFDVQRGQLTLTGFPYWYCWRRKISDQTTFNDLQARANERAREVIEREFERDRGRLSASEFKGKWTPRFQELRQREVFDQMVSANLLQPLPELSQMITEAVRQRQGINPVVYNALTATMRSAALFRHAKIENPEGYAAFVRQLAEVRPAPPVETPTVLLSP